MKIELKRLNDAFQMEASNEMGNKIVMDASPDVGGSGLGLRPMQTLLAALGGCSSIDVIHILKKQRQDLRDIQVTVTGEREKGAEVAPFVSAHLHFRLYGNIEREKAEKAVSLSVEKYCSVAKTIEKTTQVTFSFELLP